MRRTLFAIAALLAAAPAASAATLTVRVDGLQSGQGQVGCALFTRADRFPDGSRGAVQQLRKARPGGTACVFENVAPGTYAVSVVHDRNANGRLDTNLLGIPQEAWGVSNDARPAFRAPRFSEAAFRVTTDNRTLRVRVSATLFE